MILICDKWAFTLHFAVKIRIFSNYRRPQKFKRFLKVIDRATSESVPDPVRDIGVKNPPILYGYTSRLSINSCIISL